MELPNYKKNQRFVPEAANASTAYTFGLILWVASSYWFKKQIYPRDKNMFNLVMFSVGSLFSSVAISRAFLETPYTAAARINNLEELRHQRKLGHQ